MDEDSRSSRFFKLYNPVQLRLYSYLLTIVHHPYDAEEVLQETSAILWEKFDQFEEGTSFKAWAISIARNCALAFMRKNKKTRMVFDESYYEKIAQFSEHASDDISDRVQALEHCLSKLSGRQKKLLVLRYNKDISIKRISQMTGRSINGLYQSFSYIIKGLRNCMTKYMTRMNS